MYDIAWYNMYIIYNSLFYVHSVKRINLVKLFKLEFCRSGQSYVILLSYVIFMNIMTFYFKIR